MERRDLLKSIPFGLLSVSTPVLAGVAIAAPEESPVEIPQAIPLQNVATDRFIEIALRCNGCLIQHLENPSEDIKMLAVMQDGNALQFIDNPSYELCIAGIKQNPYAVKHINNPCDELKWKAINACPGVVAYLHDLTEDMKLYAASHGEYFWDCVRKDASVAVRKEALKHNPNLIAFMDQTEELQTMAVQRQAWTIRQCRNPSYKVQMAAVKREGLVLHCCPDREDLNLRMAALENTQRAIYQIVCPTDAEWDFVDKNNKVVYDLAQSDYRNKHDKWVINMLSY